MAIDSIMIEAPTVALSALSQIQAAKTDIQITGGGNLLYNVIINPIATLDMFNLTQMQGGLTEYTAWKFNYFPPFDDSPTKGKFNSKLFWKVIGAIAIVVVAAVVVVVTGGAILAAIPALAGTALVVGGTAISGQLL